MPIFSKNQIWKKIINGKYYILSGLAKDIINYPYLPLDSLLIRNESYQKFEVDGGKGLINKLGLYDPFISYIKEFIGSKTFRELIKNNICENIGILLGNKDILNEMLDEIHFRFLPFYGSGNVLGYTDKNLMISFINSIPENKENLGIISKDDDINNLCNIFLLFSIGVKFVGSLHELIIHLVNSYLRIRINFYSFKI